MLLALKLTLPFLLLTKPSPIDCSSATFTVLTLEGTISRPECEDAERAFFYATQGEAVDMAAQFPCEEVVALIDLRYPRQLSLKCREVRIPGRTWTEVREEPPTVEWRYWVEP